jgi:hypothetical protein
MQGIDDVDPRLNKRYQQMVKESIGVNKSTSSGHKAMLTINKSFASTQAAWRFYKNDKITLEKLGAPLRTAALSGVVNACQKYALCIHDWSRLKYITHKSKQDTYKMTHAYDVGYSLQTSLVVSDIDGEPIAPVAQRIVNSEGSYATYYETDEPQEIRNNLDELCKAIEHSEQQCFDKPLVHIVDREADSIWHIRKIHEDSSWLIRARKTNYVDHEGISKKLSAIADELPYKALDKVDYKGTKQVRTVAETIVTISRPAQPSQKKGYQKSVPGKAIQVRLVVCRVMNTDNTLLAQWLLLTNVNDEKAQTICNWYYWRWRIESFFKLMKKGGYELEHWQQNNALSILKRLLVVCMACVFSWRIALNDSEESKAFRDFLVRLSGKQLKRGKTYTHNAILSGLWIFFSMSSCIQSFGIQKIQQFQNVMEDIFV